MLSNDSSTSDSICRSLSIVDVVLVEKSPPKSRRTVQYGGVKNHPPLFVGTIVLLHPARVGELVTYVGSGRFGLSALLSSRSSPKDRCTFQTTESCDVCTRAWRFRVHPGSTCAARTSLSGSMPISFSSSACLKLFA